MNQRVKYALILLAGTAAIVLFFLANPGLIRTNTDSSAAAKLQHRTIWMKRMTIH